MSKRKDRTTDDVTIENKMKTIGIEDLRNLNNNSFVDIAEDYNVRSEPLRDSEVYEINDSYTSYYVDAIIDCISDVLLKNDNLKNLVHFLEEASNDDATYGVKIDADSMQKDITHLNYKLAYLFKTLEDSYYIACNEMMRDDLYKSIDYFGSLSSEALEKLDREIGIIEIVSQSGKIALSDMCSNILEVLGYEYVWFDAEQFEYETVEL